MFTNNSYGCVESDGDFPKSTSDKSNGSDSSAFLNAFPQLYIVSKAGVEMRNKATRIQMEEEWRNSRMYIHDLHVVISMRKTGMYKNVYQQYNWYLDQVFQKHSDQFRTHMENINESKRKEGVITRECRTPQDVVHFQYEYKHKITGRRGGVYAGFSKDNVKEQFGLSLESLLIFRVCSESYTDGMTYYTADSPKCLITQLMTRMQSSDNIHYLTLVDDSLPSVLSEVVDAISKLSTTSYIP